MTTPNQSFTFNAYQSNLSGPLLAGLTTVVLDFIPAGLGTPAYLVIDPDVPAAREYIKVLAYTGNTIDSMERNLEASAGDVDHLVGAVIRAVYTMQALDDTFLDIEGNTTAQTAHAGDVGDPHAAANYAKLTDLTTHIDDVGDPHAAAGYIKDTEADALYLRLDGSSPMAAAIDMANNLINQLGNPLVDDDAATKKYVDDQDALHLLLTGGTLTGQLTVSDTSNQISIFDTDQGANPRANLDHNSGALAVRIGDTGDFVNVFIFDRVEVRTGDVPLRTIRSGNEDMLMMENTAATHQWRWRVDNAGRLNLSSSPDGVVYTVVEQWLPL